MAHNLNFDEASGQHRMFEVLREGASRAWHKLGQTLNHPATAKEAIELAHLDYTVKKMPLCARVPNDMVLQNPDGTMTVVAAGTMIDVPDKFATVRTDTNQPLGVVGARYMPVQNIEGFEFFDALVGEGEACYETAGVLGKGERMWIMAKLPDFIRVGKDDIVEEYLLLTNSHDGSEVIRAKLTGIRAVCENTVNAAMREMGEEVRITHSRNAKQKLAEAHRILGLTNKIYEQLGTLLNAMNDRKITVVQQKQYVDTVFPMPSNVFTPSSTLIETREKVLELADRGQGSEMARGTLWGAYNGVTEYIDHTKEYRNGKDGKINSVMFGSGAMVKQRAFFIAQDLLKNSTALN